MRIRIFDDLHWLEIYDVLKVMLPWYTYPIKKDIKDPLPYLGKIKNWDIILLDNYFDWWEWPLGDSFLWEFIKSDLCCDIIAISDFWIKLTDMFDNWKKAHDKWLIVWWVKSKKWKDIWEFLINYLKKAP